QGFAHRVRDSAGERAAFDHRDCDVGADAVITAILPLADRNWPLHVAFRRKCHGRIDARRESGQFELAVFITGGPALIAPRRRATVRGDGIQRYCHVRHSRSILGHDAASDLARLRTCDRRYEQREDGETEGQRDRETGGQGDKGTRGQREPDLSLSPLLLLSLSSYLLVPLSHCPLFYLSVSHLSPSFLLRSATSVTDC